MDAAAREPRARPARAHVGVVNLLSTLVLGLLAAVLVIEVIPRLFDIESSCLSTRGVQRAGEEYFDALVVGGTLGWLGVAVASIYASIADRPRIVLLLPLAWFLTFVLLALIVAAAIGPAPCPP